VRDERQTVLGPGVPGASPLCCNVPGDHDPPAAGATGYRGIPGGRPLGAAIVVCRRRCPQPRARSAPSAHCFSCGGAGGEACGGALHRTRRCEGESTRSTSRRAAANPVAEAGARAAGAVARIPATSTACRGGRRRAFHPFHDRTRSTRACSSVSQRGGLCHSGCAGSRVAACGAAFPPPRVHRAGGATAAGRIADGGGAPCATTFCPSRFRPGLAGGSAKPGAPGRAGTGSTPGGDAHSTGAVGQARFGRCPRDRPGGRTTGRPSSECAATRQCEHPCGDCTVRRRHTGAACPGIRGPAAGAKSRPLPSERRVGPVGASAPDLYTAGDYTDTSRDRHPRCGPAGAGRLDGPGSQSSGGRGIDRVGAGG
jgi:hypothetical protein